MNDTLMQRAPSLNSLRTDRAPVDTEPQNQHESAEAEPTAWLYRPEPDPFEIAAARRDLDQAWADGRIADCIALRHRLWKLGVPYSPTPPCATSRKGGGA